MFCKHKWEVLSETVTESAYELAMKASKEAGVSRTSLPWQLCDPERKYIQIVSCTKCGKLKRFVECL